MMLDQVLAQLSTNFSGKGSSITSGTIRPQTPPVLEIEHPHQDHDVLIAHPEMR